MRPDSHETKGIGRPMPIGDGKTIAPTSKRFALPMATIGRRRGISAAALHTRNTRQTRSI